MCKNNILLIIALVCIIAGLFGSLMPFSIMENESFSDSLASEEFVMLPVLLTVTGLFFLLTSLGEEYFAVPQQFSFLLVPPPISN